MTGSAAATKPRVVALLGVLLAVGALGGCLTAGTPDDPDGDGFVTNDCAPDDGAVHPGAPEVCDGVDNDCDGAVDDNRFGAPTWYVDGDGDGFGDPASLFRACDGGAATSRAGDCDDGRDDVHPEASEVCDARDNDCDGVIDADAVDRATWYRDDDGDGVGDGAVTLVACDQPPGFVATPGDCDDHEPLAVPGGVEVCDGVDNDCDSATTADGGEADADNDGVPECLDCDEGNALIPTPLELCDGVDSDCDPTTVAVGETDSDGDGVLACADCDDVDADNLPGGVEVCDGVDNDCDGVADVTAALPGDSDFDGVSDLCDVCPGSDDGADADSDGVADGCDVCPLDAADDSDGDGVCDTDDVCPGEDDAEDADSDGVPDACDVCPLDAADDSDGDGICDTDDACPGDDALDTDGDQVADGCDVCPLDAADDSDGDGVCDTDDVCPGSDDSADGDADGLPDACDACPADPNNDTDGDGVCDPDDVCPLDANDDSDGDGSCDSADICPGSDDGVDGDGDGVPDGCDVCPLDAPDDSDGDGSCDADDVCPGFDDFEDLDNSGYPDGCEPDQCAGGAVLFVADMEVGCPGFSLSGDWQCGTPTSGPNAAFSGSEVLATNLSGDYANGLTWATNTATFGPIDLTTSTFPQLELLAWTHTEGFTFDGWNLQVSADGGGTFLPLTNVFPPYSLTVAGEPAWGGDLSASGWVAHTASLVAYSGQQVFLRVAMASDPSIPDPGVYVDDVFVCD